MKYSSSVGVREQILVVFQFPCFTVSVENYYSIFSDLCLFRLHANAIDELISHLSSRHGVHSFYLVKCPSDHNACFILLIDHKQKQI